MEIIKTLAIGWVGLVVILAICCGLNWMGQHFAIVLWIVWALLFANVVAFLIGKFILALNTASRQQPECPADVI